MPKNPNSKIKTFYRFMLYLLPAVLFFSYYPLLHFGANDSMNFELSLPLIWLVAFAVLSFILIIKEKKFTTIFKNWALLLFPIFLTLSILWSENKVRGILTIAIFWLIYFAGFSIYIFKDYFKAEKTKQIFWKWFFGSAVVVCVWCFLQCALDLMGAPRDYSLMCEGCTYQMFGFPHPNGFAIEPQFMGNLLLAPALMSMYFSMKNKKYLWLLFIFTATLFLTFSRGAIYAFIIAMIFMTIWGSKYLARNHKDKWFQAPLKIWLVTIGAFLFSLNAQGIMAQVSPTNDTYFSGISKVLNHLSLGIVDTKKANAKEEAVFDGYVEESTNTRLRLSQAAIQVWAKTPSTFLFGVGLGGAGQALYLNNLSPSPKEITQNQYTSVLLESGIVGVLLLIFTLVLILRALIKTTAAMPILTLLIAYAVVLAFFSGLPNALHIYLLPPILTILLNQSSFRKKLVS